MRFLLLAVGLDLDVKGSVFPLVAVGNKTERRKRCDNRVDRALIAADVKERVRRRDFLPKDLLKP